MTKRAGTRAFTGCPNDCRPAIEMASGSAAFSKQSRPSKSGACAFSCPPCRSWPRPCTSIEELISEPAKRGPAPKLQQQLEQLSRLPKAQQKLVSQVIDSVLAQSLPRT
jgi:hypothetical protein